MFQGFFFQNQIHLLWQAAKALQNDRLKSPHLDRTYEMQVVFNFDSIAIGTFSYNLYLT